MRITLSPGTRQPMSKLLYTMPKTLAGGVYCSVWSVLFLVASPTNGLAQAVATPNSHWGAIMLPDLEHRVDWGLHFVAFTEYGKEVQAGTEEYAFEPYNDIRETIGFNFFALSHSDDGRRAGITRSSVQIRKTLFVGVVADHVTEFLQNDVAHWAKFRDIPLRRVPRTLEDTQEETSLGPRYWFPPILGYSREYFVRFDERRRQGEYDLVSPSKFFVGGGFVVSTINHEGFLHIGSNPIEFDFGTQDCCERFCFETLGIGGMLRAGVVLPSFILKDLTTDYLQLQSVADMKLRIAAFPLTFSVSVTGTRGFFAEARTLADFSRAERDERDARDVFGTKRSKRERLLGARLRIGAFSFELLNDNLGGKDKGPTFGVHASFVTRGDSGFLRWLGMAENGS